VTTTISDLTSLDAEADRRHVVRPDPHHGGPTEADQRPTLRRDDRLHAIDGLRGLCLLVVLAYHFNENLLPGGFLGVDVFLVISGFVVTRVLLRDDGTTGRARFVGFYARRIRRLAPSLLLTVFGTVVALSVTGDYTPARRWDALASLGLVMNWREALTGSSYFDAFGPVSPMRHLWSLSVEEQWYLVWPFALTWLLTHRRTTVNRILMCLAACVAVWWWAVVFDASDPSRAYYGTDTRLLLLLLGAALAVHHHHNHRRRVPSVVGLLGCVVFLISCRFASPTASWSHPWLFLAAGIVSVGILSSTTVASPAMDRVLGNRPLRWLGDASYAIYLWHWPILLAVPTGWLTLPFLPTWMVRLAVVLALGAATLHFVERPIRCLPAARVVPVAAAAFVIVAVVVIATPVTSQRRNGERSSIAASAVAPREARSSVLVTVIGDSVAASLADGVASETLPLVSVDAQAVPGCGVPAEAIRTADEVVPRGAQCVVAGLRWEQRIRDTRPDVVLTMLGGWELFDVVVAGRTLAFGTTEWAQHMTARLDEWFAPAREVNASVLILDNPCYAIRERRRTRDGERYDRDRQRELNAFLRSYASTRRGTLVVAASDAICEDGRPIDESDRYDGVHFTDAGAQRVWTWLVPIVQAIAGPNAPVEGAVGGTGAAPSAEQDFVTNLPARSDGTTDTTTPD
jgi:peptidoglycan/LPS O-acetylase OafA/YrhL/lysophospholipase L1-like esterase